MCPSGMMDGVKEGISLPACGTAAGVVAALPCNSITELMLWDNENSKEKGN